MNPELASSSPNAAVAAVNWLEASLVGTLATTVAIIAVAWFGMMLLAGHVPSRRGVQIIFGCFIIFGASSIAAGITNALGKGPTEFSSPAPEPPLLVVSPVAPLRPGPVPPYDPYAGAALPPRR